MQDGHRLAARWRPAARGAIALDSLHRVATPRWPQPADTGPDDPGFWLYSSGSTGRPKGTVHTHANPYWTAELYGTAVLGVTESDVCFSAAKLFFAYGLGNALSFPLSVGATTILMAERPTPDAVFKRWHGEVGNPPTVFFGAPTGFAGMLASPDLPAQRRRRAAPRVVGRRGAAGRARRSASRAHFGVDIVDGIGSTEMLHIFLSNLPGDVRYGTTGWPVPGYDIELRGDDGSPVPDGETGDLYIQRPERGADVLGQPRKVARNLPGRAGPRAATSTCATTTAATPTAAAATTCSRSAASTSRRSRSRPRWCSTRPCSKRR